MVGKDDYKKTEVGSIPIDWNVIQLYEKIKVQRGGSPRPIEHFLSNNDKGYNWIKIGDTEKGGKYISKTKEKIISDGLSKTRFVSRGDLLLSNSMSFGRPYILKIDGCIHDGWLVLHDYIKSYDKEYLYYLLSSECVLKQYLSLASGSGVLNLNKDIVSSINLPLPPLPEQQAIAEVLSDTDNLIQALEKQIAKKQLIKQGVMQKLLTAKEGWVKKKLGESSDIFRGGSPRPIESYLTTNPDGINWIKIGDVGRFAKFIESTEEKIIPEGMSRSRFVKEGDFLLSNSMSFGRPYILKTRGCIHDGWLVIQNYQNHFDREFLYYVLGSESVIMQYKAMASGSSVLNLNKEIVKNVIINCPTSLKEQSRISAILSDIDNEINLLEHKLLKDKLIKQGLMQNLLTGNIRLVKS